MVVFHLLYFDIFFNFELSSIFLIYFVVICLLSDFPKLSKLSCFGNNLNQLVFRIHFQYEACFLKVCFLFRSHHLWIHNVCDLTVISNFLCGQYPKGLIEFFQLIVFC